MNRDLLANVKWEPVRHVTTGSDLPYATHHAVLELPGIQRMRVYRLNTGEAIVHADDLKAFLSYLEVEGAEAPSFEDGALATGPASELHPSFGSDANYRRNS